LFTPGNCQNADCPKRGSKRVTPIDGTVDFLDFADFEPQWLQCNNPEDPDCTHNW
jgi:hypothetical protein